METDDALAVGCELVEQGLAHRRGTLRIMMVGGGIHQDFAPSVVAISVGEGMSASTSNEDMDAMFQPRPHGAIAVGPLSANPHQHGGKVNSSHGTPSFLSWRTSLAASATSQSRKVTIFGRDAVAFGQMIQ